MPEEQIYKLTVGVLGDSIETPSPPSGDKDCLMVGYPQRLFLREWLGGTWFGLPGATARMIDSPEAAIYPGGDWRNPQVLPQDKILRTPCTYFQLQAFRMRGFDFVALRFGLNEALKGVNPQHYKGSLYGLGHQLRYLGVGHVMLMGSHCPAGPGNPVIGDRLKSYRAIHEEIARDPNLDGLFVLGPDFNDGDDYMPPGAPFFHSSDPFHPNNTGHEFMADRLVTYLPAPCNAHSIEGHCGSMNQYSVRGANHCVRKGLL